jgi:lipoprotein signal peptidase
MLAFWSFFEKGFLICIYLAIAVCCISFIVLLRRKNHQKLLHTPLIEGGSLGQEEWADIRDPYYIVAGPQ